MQKIKFNAPLLFENEQTNIRKVFLNKTFTGNGPFTKKINTVLTKLFNNSYTLVTDSNSSAMDIAADCIKIKKDDEVLVPSYEYPTTASAFLKRGAKIKFLDLDPKNFMINKEDLLRKISKKTKALVIMHYAGHSDDIEFYLKLKKKYKFFLIEDAAQTIGIKYKGKHLGTFGDFGTISFHETKNIHCGLGGALIVNNKKFIDEATYIWERGTDRKDFTIKKKYSWVANGGNYYPTEFQSAFLIEQIKNLKRVTKKREKIFKAYYSFFSQNRFKKYFYTISDNKISNYHMFYVVFNSTLLKKNFLKHMIKNNIQCQTHYEPLHTSKMGRQIQKKLKLKNVEKFSKKILRFPLHFEISSKELEYIKKNCELFFFDTKNHECL